MLLVVQTTSGKQATHERHCMRQSSVLTAGYAPRHRRSTRMHQPQLSAIDETGSYPDPFASFNDAQARLLYALVGILLGTDDLTEGVRGALRAICESQGWSIGRFWTLDERDGTLREFTSWQQGTGIHQPVLHHGSAVPRWLGKNPVWIGDLSAHELAALVRVDVGGGGVPGTGALV